MATPGNELISSLTSSSMYFVSSETATNSTRFTETTIKVGGGHKTSPAIYRSFIRFLLPKLKKNSVISSASLNIQFSNTDASPTSYQILEYPPSAQALTYNLSYWSCINGLSFGNCTNTYSWDGGLNTTGAKGTVANFGTDSGLFTPPTTATVKSIYITDLVQYYITNRSTLGLTLELMIRQSSENSTVIRQIHSYNSMLANSWPKITYDYSLPAVSLGTTTAIKNISKGKILAKINTYDNIIFNAVTVSGSRSLSDPTFVNGMPIMTSNYGSHRAIHVYEIADIGSANEMRTTWSGAPIQLISYGNADDHAILMDIEDTAYTPNNNNIDKTFLIGNLYINLDNDYRLLIHEKEGTPLETHYIFIGGNPVRIGRFADGWAIGISR